MTVTIKLHPTTPGRIAVDAAYRYKDLIKSCPGARWSKDDGRWSVPLAWSACLAMRGIFGDDLVVDPELSRWAWEHKTTVIEPSLRLREAMEAPGDEQLYSFQRAGVAWLKVVRRALLLDEMGTGKTVQSTTALRELAWEGELAGPVLVVCPNSMKGTWKRELGVWWPDAVAHIIGGTAAQRTRQFKAVSEDLDAGKQVVVIMNWEGLRSHSRLAPFGSVALRRCKACGGEDTVRETTCETHLRELNHIDFAAVVADEAHRALDPKSKQTRALRGASGDAKIRFALTGTPISKDPTQLWTILNWVDEAEWPTKSAWVERMVDYTHNIFGGREINGLNPLTEGEFRATVDPKTRRVLKEIVLPFLPPVITERREVEMAPKQRKQYKDMEELLIARLDTGTLVADNAMVQVGRLVQLASSCGDIEIRQEPDVRWFLDPVWEWTGTEWIHKPDPVSGEPMFENVKRQAVDEHGNGLLKDVESFVPIDPSAKLDAFFDDISDFGDQSVAVFAESRKLIELLSARMTKKGIEHVLLTGAVSEEDRDKAMAAFQAGEVQFILVTIKAGGTGVTLTKASVACFLQRSWSPIDMDQTYARTHRIGSEIHDSITLIQYVTKDTIEDDQLGVLERKGEMIEQIVQDEEKLRALIRGTLVDLDEALAVAS